jgi:hypothetical protein
MTDSFANVDSCNNPDHAYGSLAHITRGASRSSSSLGRSSSSESASNEAVYKHPDWLLPREHKKSNWYHDFSLKIEDVLAEIKKRKSTSLPVHGNTKPFKRLLFLFDDHHTEKDLRNMVDAFCEKYNMRPMSGAAHRDEGSVTTAYNRDTNEVVETVKYNLHYHLMFTNVIPGQKHVSAIGGMGDTSLMQDFFAETLGMNRGVGKYAPALDQNGEVIIRTEGKHKGKPMFATQIRREHINEVEYRRRSIVESKENMEKDVRWLADQKAKLTAENQQLKAVLDGDKQTKKNLAVVNVVARQQLTDLGIGEPEHYAELKKIKDTFCKGVVSIADVFHQQMSFVAQLKLDAEEAKDRSDQEHKNQLQKMNAQLLEAERMSMEYADAEDLLEAVEARLSTGTLAVDLIKNFVKKMARKLFSIELAPSTVPTLGLAPKLKPKNSGR